MNICRLFARKVVLCTLASTTLTLFAFPGSAQVSPALSAGPVNLARNFVAVPDDPEAIYEGARIVHNVTVNGQKGMRVHATFRVKYGLDTPCMLIAYFFYDDAKPTALKTSDAKYRTKAGTVYAHTNFTPAYDPAVYKDLQLFMPYSALNMESGEEYQLKFYLALYDNEGERFFGKSSWYKFNLTMP